MRTVKLGLIGAGGIAQAHCGTIANIDGAEIIAAADLVPANLERAKERWGIKRTFSDYNEMLKMDEIEAVYVCTRRVCMPHRLSPRSTQVNTSSAKSRWRRHSMPPLQCGAPQKKTIKS